MSERIEYCVTPEEAGTRLDAFLSSKCADLARTRIKDAIEAGDVEIGGHVVTKAARKCLAGETIAFQKPPAPADPMAPQPESIDFDVLYRDDAIFVVSKPCGLVVHPGAGHTTGTLVNGLLQLDPAIAHIGEPDRPGIVHRLDRETSGLMIVARSQQAYTTLVDMFSRHAIQRQYWAICHAPHLPDAGTFDTPYGRHPTQRVKFTARPNPHETGDAPKRAITHYEVLARSHGGFALVTCRLETGRTHQVRVHLSEHGAPILGDALYAPSAVANHRSIGRLALHAGRLQFLHPITGENMTFEVPLPKEFLDAMRKLGIHYDIP